MSAAVLLGSLSWAPGATGSQRPASSYWRARIALEDGTPLPTLPLIRVIPGQLGGCRIHDTFGNGTVLYSSWTDDETTRTDQCLIEIRLEGFRMKRVTLRDGAVVVLKRLGESEGSTVPASSLNAPPGARKEFEQGAKALRNGDWRNAQQHLEQAIAIYGEYAQAYADLGEALERQSKTAEARAAYERALAISPKYLRPYAQLARLAIGESRFSDAVAITEQAMQLNPLEFPSIYFYNAQAHFELHDSEAAEKSARQAVEQDVDRQVPRSLYLLGLILEQKGEKKDAIAQYRAYVGVSPKPADAAEVKRRIAALRKGQQN